MSDAVVVWQQQFYVPLELFMGILPAVIAHCGWNDGLGGLVYGTFVRVVHGSHIMFLINSVTHAPWAGTQPYSDKFSARNVPLLGLISYGGGNHNYHHAFPSDYQSGLHWNEPDVSKLVIWLWYRLAWATNLKTTSQDEIKRAQHRQANRAVLPDRVRDVPQLPALPVMEWDAYTEQVACGCCLVSISGMVHNVTDFMSEHPGGSDLIQEAIGNDATDAFYGGQHLHSSHTETCLRTMRIAILHCHPHSKVAWG